MALQATDLPQLNPTAPSPVPQPAAQPPKAPTQIGVPGFMGGPLPLPQAPTQPSTSIPVPGLMGGPVPLPQRQVMPPSAAFPTLTPAPPSAVPQAAAPAGAQQFGGVPTLTPTPASPVPQTLGNGPVPLSAVQEDFDPNSLPGLRGQAILPGDSPFQGIGAENSQQLEALRNAFSQQLLGLGDAPDRQQLALEQMRLFDEQAAPALAERIQGIGRDAAKFGRIGSGVTTSRTGDAFTEAEANRALVGRQIANETAGMQLQDRLSSLGALGAGSGQLFGQEQALRGEARGERDASMGADFLGRQELRGERDYGDNLAGQALNNRIQQRMLEEQLLGSQFDRNMRQAGMAGDLGFGFDPSRTFLGGADRESALAESLFGAGAGALGQVGQNRGGQADILSQLLGNINLGGGGDAPPVGSVSPSGSTVGGALDPGRLAEMLLGN